MNKQEELIFKEITSNQKWYAGLKTNKGVFYTAQTAFSIKKRFEKGKLSKKQLEYIFNKYSYYQETIWKKKQK